MMKKYLPLLILMCFSSITNAQILDPTDDGIVPQASRHYNNNRVVPYPYLRQDDMLWSERHWERIDLREKINLPLYYPLKPMPDRKALWNVLVDGILTGKKFNLSRTQSKEERTGKDINVDLIDRKKINLLNKY